MFIALHRLVRASLINPFVPVYIGRSFVYVIAVILGTINETVIYVAYEVV